MWSIHRVSNYALGVDFIHSLKSVGKYPAPYATALSGWHEEEIRGW